MFPPDTISALCVDGATGQAGPSGLSPRRSFDLFCCETIRQ